ncbi:unnamed protein product, partial [Amoebophrya sp. A120]
KGTKGTGEKGLRIQLASGAPILMGGAGRKGQDEDDKDLSRMDATLYSEEAGAGDVPPEEDEEGTTSTRGEKRKTGEQEVEVLVQSSMTVEEDESGRSRDEPRKVLEKEEKGSMGGGGKNDQENNSPNFYSYPSESLVTTVRFNNADPQAAPMHLVPETAVPIYEPRIWNAQQVRIKV